MADLEANKELVRRLYDEGFNKGDLDLVDELVAPDRRGGATGKRGTMRAFFIWRIENGKLAESWGVADRFGMLQELGIVPSDDELAARMPKTEDST